MNESHVLDEDEITTLLEALTFFKEKRTSEAAMEIIIASAAGRPPDEMKERMKTISHRILHPQLKISSLSRTLIS
jgi:hypothetical protein